MGIESISRVSGTQSYQTTASVKSSPEAVSVEPLEAAQLAAGAAGQPLEAKDSLPSGDEAGTEKKAAATMKDVNDFNKIINHNTVAEFGYNEPTNRITIKIKDKETDEVIKEIPSEKALEMLARAWELAGILVDEKR